MVRKEETYRRDLTYSQFHRTLPDWCYMIDIDSIEWREGRGIVAIIETTKMGTPLDKKKFEVKILRELAKKLKIPTFIVEYNEDCTQFIVYNLLNYDNKKLNRDEYNSFIKSL